MEKIWYFLTYKVYQNNLLTSGTADYLNAVSVIVFLALLSEAFAWGYLGSVFTPDNPYLGGVGLGAFIFLLLWFFDRTMITQDMMNAEHAKTLKGDEYDEHNANFLKKHGRYFVLVIRLVIVVASLCITAPFVTQLVFKNDIDNEMQKQYQNSINQAKQEVLGKLEHKINAQEDYIKQINERLQQEIGGKRGTGYGRGVVAQSIEAELAAANNEFEQLKQQLFINKSRLETAIIQDDHKTLESFGIFMVKDSPIFRGNSIQKLKAEPSFWMYSIAVHLALAMVGTILVLSKVLQPHPLKLYYSSRLQEAWVKYKQGMYDDYLLESNKSICMPDTPTPQIFEEIAIDYAQTKNERIKDDIECRQKQKHTQQLAEQEQQRLKDSKQAYNERCAKELQLFSYEDKVVEQKKSRVLEALKRVDYYLKKFKQEEYPDKQKLLAQQEELEEELFQAKRLYASKEEDMMARQERFYKEQNKLEELQQLSQTQEQKQADSPTLENTKAFIATQDALEKQKQTIKNMQDNYLTFERDMNIHQEKVDNLESELHYISTQIQALNDKEIKLKRMINELESEELEYLSEIAKSDSTSYIKGDDLELPFIAQSQKIDGGIYKVQHFNHDKDERGDE